MLRARTRYTGCVRKLITLCLTLFLVLSPVAGTIAVAFGASGDHAHYDHVWHAVDLDQHIYSDSSEHGAPQQHGHENAPPGHSHADHVHLAVFMPSYPTAALGHPDGQSHIAGADAGAPDHRSYPPFRPPQSL